MHNRLVRTLCAAALALATAVPAVAQNRVTSPEEQFGFELGADYQLINYEQFHDSPTSRTG